MGKFFYCKGSIICFVVASFLICLNVYAQEGGYNFGGEGSEENAPAPSYQPPPSEAPTTDEQPREEPRGVRSLDYKEVEKGFFSELDFGPMMAVSGFSDESGLKLGFSSSVGFGYDILDFLSLNAVLGIMHWSSGGPTKCTIGTAGCDPPANDPYATGEKVTAPPSDLFGIAPMVQVKFAFVSTFRTYFYLRATGGMMLAAPKETLGSSAPIVGGSLGIEYYTGLRHFSVGIEPGVLAVMGSGVTGISATLLPTLKYTF